MYQAYWQLAHRPFENTADPRFYYPGESHQGALLKLRYAIENHAEAAMLCGASGTGKSLLAHHLRRHLDKRFSPIVHLVFPQMSACELLSYLVDELAAPDGNSRSLDQTVRRLGQFIHQNASQDQHAVAIIDEAHLIDDSQAFEALRLLLNFEHDGRPALTLLLVGQPALLPQMDRMTSLEERLSVKCLLRPFTVDETAAYVNFRLQAAGAKRAIFEPEAIQTLFELSGGLPRKINRLCDLALLVGYAEQRQSIGHSELEAVAEELVAVAPE